MNVGELNLRGLWPSLEWLARREVPCKDLDLDCFAFDGIIPFGDYARCHAYEPQAGRCIFLSCTEQSAT